MGYRVDDLVIDVGSRRVIRHGKILAVRGLSFDLLLTLVRHAPNVVSIDALMDEVWPGVVVSPETVTKRVKLLRDALDDRGEQPRYLSVVRGHGYRLHAPVQPEPAEPVRRSRQRAVTMLAGGSLLAAAALLAVVQPWRDAPAAPAQDARKMIAVLPFVNLGPGEDDDFAAGITEELTSRLAAIRELGVISRTSASQYDRRGKTIGEIGRDLGVEYVLEGSLRWDRRPAERNRVRITPQLIRVEDDTHLWAGSYDVVIDDIFQAQSDIASAIVGQLHLALSPDERRHVEAASTVDIDAYHDYLKAVVHSAAPANSSESTR